MPYSAKSLIQKIKDLEDIENQKRERELMRQAEEKKREQEQLKKDLHFYTSIGKKCIEAALDGKTCCAIDQKELTSFRTQILQCGLIIQVLELNPAQIEEEFPEFYKALNLEDQLTALENKYEEAQNTGSDFYDTALANLNDVLYELFERAVEDEWHVHFLEKQLIDDINETSFINSDLYESDHALLLGMNELLNVLKKYQYKELVDEDSLGESSATPYLREIVSKIEDIETAVFNNKGIVNTIIANSKEIKDQIDEFLEQTYSLTTISWARKTFSCSIERYKFLSPDSLEWLTDNPLMIDFFKLIEKNIAAKEKSCEFIFDQYSKSSNSYELLEDGLFFDDFLIEISIEDLANVFRSLEYSVKVKTTKISGGEPSNLIFKHALLLSW
jgi:hypothetical protein